VVPTIEYDPDCFASKPERSPVIAEQEAIPADGIETLVSSHSSAGHPGTNSQSNPRRGPKERGVVGHRVISHDDAPRRNLCGYRLRESARFFWRLRHRAESEDQCVNGLAALAFQCASHRSSNGGQRVALEATDSRQFPGE
jgi:hypothetical protein